MPDYRIPIFLPQKFDVFDILHGRVKVPNIVIPDVKKEDMGNIQDCCMELMNYFALTIEAQIRSKN